MRRNLLSRDLSALRTAVSYICASNRATSRWANHPFLAIGKPYPNISIVVLKSAALGAKLDPSCL